MKNFFFSILLMLGFSYSKACSFYYPDADYFNLFTQTIIQDKSYVPFLLVYDASFYDDGKKRFVPDENIISWKNYFSGKISFEETEYLVNHLSMDELNLYKKGNTNQPILKKLGSYEIYREGIDYLIEAKYLEPYMMIVYQENPDSFYYREDETEKNASNLDYQKTINALVSLYHNAKNPEIKQRYGYQLVRFDHYTLHFERAIANFKKYVEPFSLRAAPYYLALDQMAGAQRGLKNYEEANWNFFQVFKHLSMRRESAYKSIKISDKVSFEYLLERAKTPEDKNMAYFLLGYRDFTDPIPVMEKMYNINPNSEILKVMAARSINQMEREYLSTYIGVAGTEYGGEKNIIKNNNNPTIAEETSFWQKIVNFFRNLFGSDKNSTDQDEKSNKTNDEELINDPNRIPVYFQNSYVYDNEAKNYLDDLSKFISRTKEKSDDAFWDIADAYTKFLQKEHEETATILQQIRTTNPEYLAQIERMMMLNEITSQPRIDEDFENLMTKKYPNLLEEPQVKDSLKAEMDYYAELPSTQDFVRDIFANRYFLQGDHGKSFLMSNRLSELKYRPDVSLAKEIQNFIHKKDKNGLEQKLMENVDLKDPDAFFSILYGDQEMRDGRFEAAEKHYANAKDFEGFQLMYKDDHYASSAYSTVEFPADRYDGFKNVSSLIFGHNRWESFQSKPNETMIAESFVNEFAFIIPKMTKYELAKAMVQLKKMGDKKGVTAAKANQLIGNVLYNTTMLGYFREVFSMDSDNSGWAKNDIYRNKFEKPSYYYKSYAWNPSLKPDNFDVAISYYEKAMQQTPDQEQKARIVFQMASAEQGKYAQWAASQEEDFDYDDPKWQQKNDAFNKNLVDTKNEKYKKYFSLLKKEYSQTSVSRQLQGSCSYYDYFLKR